MRNGYSNRSVLLSISCVNFKNQYFSRGNRLMIIIFFFISFLSYLKMTFGAEYISSINSDIGHTWIKVIPLKSGKFLLLSICINKVNNSSNICADYRNPDDLSNSLWNGFFINSTQTQIFIDLDSTTLSNGNIALVYTNLYTKNIFMQIRSESTDQNSESPFSNIILKNTRINVNNNGFEQNPKILNLNSEKFFIYWQAYNSQGIHSGLFGKIFFNSLKIFREDFKINSKNTNLQYTQASACALKKGGFVIAWTSQLENLVDNNVILIQIFNEFSEKMLKEEINSNKNLINSNNKNPSLSCLNNGNFVLTFTNTNGLDSDGDGVFGKIFDSSGNIVVEQFNVNSYNISHQNKNVVYEIDIAQSGFLVLWQSLNQTIIVNNSDANKYSDVDGYGIYCQLFDSKATKIGDEFLVNNFYKQYDQTNATIAKLENNNFIIAWENYSNKTENQYSNSNIVFNLFYFEGLINTRNIYSDQTSFKACELNSGNFVITWNGEGYNNNRKIYDLNIYAKIINNKKEIIKSDFLINTENLDFDQKSPVVASFNTGSQFIIAWLSYDPLCNKWLIFAKIFQNFGEVLIDSKQLNLCVDANYNEIANLSLFTFINGKIVLYWQQTNNINSNNDEMDIYFSVYDYSLIILKDIQKINQNNTGFQVLPKFKIIESSSKVQIYAMFLQIRSNLIDDGNSFFFKIYNSDLDNTSDEKELKIISTPNKKINNYDFIINIDKNIIIIYDVEEKIITNNLNNIDNQNYGIFAQTYILNDESLTPPIQIKTFNSNQVYFSNAILLENYLYISYYGKGIQLNNGFDISVLKTDLNFNIIFEAFPNQIINTNQILPNLTKIDNNKIIMIYKSDSGSAGSFGIFYEIIEYCTENFFLNKEKGYICKRCNIECENGCIDKSSNCVDCSLGAYRKEDEINFINNSECYFTSPIKYFFNNQINVYSLCGNDCYTCEKDSLSCTSCIDKLYPIFNLLITPCYDINDSPEGYYFLRNFFRKCNDSCKTCKNNPNYCLECNTDYFNFVKNPNSCTRGQVNGYFFNKEISLYDNCDSSCSNCVDRKDKCTQCNTNYYALEDDLTTCKNKAPDNYYIDLNAKLIKRCSKQCELCKDKADFCLKCNYQDKYFPLTNDYSKCFIDCPDFYWKNFLKLECSLCDISCRKCQNENPICIECAPNYFSLSDDSSKCVLNPPNNTYKYDIKTSNWYKCPFPGLICNDDKTYKICADNYFLFLPNLQCLKECPDFYFNNISNKQCDKCLGNCLTCKNTPYECKKCINGFFFYNEIKENNCLEDCPNNYFKDYKSFQCSKCHEICDSCIDKEDNCIKCKSGSLLVKGINKCVSECPNHYYKNNENTECIKCSDNCLECKEFSNCIICQKNMFLDLNKNFCVIKCIDGFYGDIIDNICKACDSSCLTCKGGSSSDCLSCDPLKTLMLRNNKCTDDCETGFIRLQNQKSCFDFIKCFKILDFLYDKLFSIGEENFRVELYFILTSECQEYLNNIKIKWSFVKDSYLSKDLKILQIPFEKLIEGSIEFTVDIYFDEKFLIKSFQGISQLKIFNVN